MMLMLNNFFMSYSFKVKASDNLSDAYYVIRNSGYNS